MNNSILDDEFSGNDIDINNVELAGFWIRLGATLLDGLILIPVTGLGIYNSMDMKSMPLMLMISLFSFLYKPYLEWTRSATYGKSILGLKVVDESMNDINLDQVIKRYFPWVISFAFSMATSIWMYSSTDFQNINDFTEIGLLANQSPFSSITSMYSFIFIGLIGSLAFDPKKQGFHDKHAGTYCVKVDSLEQDY